MKRLSDCQVLVVDDSLEEQMVVESLLMSICHIHSAASGEEAIRFACKTPPDLILLDVVMPGMDGFDTCQALKILPVTARTPICFSSILTTNTTEFPLSRPEGWII